MITGEQSDVDVEVLRTAISASGPKRGLTADMIDLIAGAWAAQTKRSWFLHSSPIDEPSIGDIRRGTALRLEPLPDHYEWHKAITRWKTWTGQTVNEYLTATNLAALADNVRSYARTTFLGRSQFVNTLGEAYRYFEIDREKGRYALAADLAELFETRLTHVDNLGLVAAIAEAPFRGSDVEASKSLTSTADIEQALIRYPLSQWKVLREAVDSGATDRAAGATVILEKLKQAFEAQETVQSLPVALSSADRARDAWLEDIATKNPSPEELERERQRALEIEQERQRVLELEQERERQRQLQFKREREALEREREDLERERVEREQERQRALESTEVITVADPAAVSALEAQLRRMLDQHPNTKITVTITRLES